MANSQVFVIDPMLATGVRQVCPRTGESAGARHIRLLGVIAAPEGIAAIHAEHPDVLIYVAAVDERLNEKGYIVPGPAMPAIGSSAPLIVDEPPWSTV